MLAILISGGGVVPAHHTSASQVELFNKCPRAWVDQYLDGNKSEPTASQSLGTDFHSVVESYVTQDGVWDFYETPSSWKGLLVGRSARSPFDPRLSGMFSAALPYLPDPKMDIGMFAAEGEILLPTYSGGPNWKGFIDIRFPGGPPRAPNLTDIGGGPTVRDYKTTSDLRYAKTPQELAENIQMVSYGHAEIALHGAKDVALEHLYVTTRPRHKAHLVRTPRLSADWIESRWSDALDKVREMEVLRAAHAAGQVTTDEVAPLGVDTGHCNAYGGCPRRAKCQAGAETLTQITRKPQTTKETQMAEMSLMEKLKLMAANGGVLPASAPPAETQPPVQVQAEGVVPPDAPPREQPAETIAPPPHVVAAQTDAEPAAPAEPAESTEEAPKKRRGRPTNAERAARSAGPASAPVPARTTCPACSKPTPLDAEGRFVDHKGVNDEFKPDDMVWCITSGDSVTEAVDTVRRLHDAMKPKPTESETAPIVEYRAAGGSVVLSVSTEAVDALVAAVAAPPPANDNGIEAIYVDCIPLKGAHKAAFTMAEDWLAPIARAAAEANKVADYRLISYTSKGVLADAINKARQLGAVPAVLVVSSYTPGSDVVLESLVPFARTVVRALRG